MGLRKLNRQKNYLIRQLKTKITKLIVDHKTHIPFDPLKVKHILFLRDDDKFGDMIVSTLAFREAKKAGYQVSVVAGPNTHTLLEHNPYIDHLHICSKKNSKQLGKEISKQAVDLLIDMGDILKAGSLQFIADVKATYNLGFDKTHYQLFDISFDKQQYYKKHISYRYKLIFDLLGLTSYSLTYDLHISPEVEQKVISYFEQFKPHPIIVLNPFTASNHKDLSEQQLNNMINSIININANTAIILIGQQTKISKLNLNHTHCLPFTHIEYALAAIKYADFIISPDTSIVHAATAFNKNILTFYRKNSPNDDNPMSTLWAPNNPHATIIFTPDIDGDVSDIDSQEIIKVLKHILLKLFML